MKIVYLNYLHDSRKDSVGASVHVRQLVEALAGRGHEIKSFNLNRAMSDKTGVGDLRGQTRGRAKRFLRRYVGQLSQFLKNGRLFFKERRILKDERPDILLVRYNLLNFTAPLAARFLGIPVVLEVNSPHAYERKHMTKDVWHLPLLPIWTERLNLRLADRIITVSRSLKNFYVKQNVSEDKIFVVPNGVNVDRFTPDVSSRSLRRGLGMDERTVLGFIGSFHYWHGIDHLLHLIEHTVDDYAQIVYLLVGDGPMREEAEDFIRSRGYQDRVLFTGYVSHEEIPKYLAALDIALAPYPPMDFFYFSPLKLFEYMASGKATIASDIGQISEIISDGQNGRLYSPHNLDTLLGCARELIEQPKLRKKIGQCARATVLERYTWTRNADNVLQVIGTLNGRVTRSGAGIVPQPIN